MFACVRNLGAALYLTFTLTLRAPCPSTPPCCGLCPQHDGGARDENEQVEEKKKDGKMPSVLSPRRRVYSTHV